jgi:hypothetical protein
MGIFFKNIELQSLLKLKFEFKTTAIALTVVVALCKKTLFFSGQQERPLQLGAPCCP